MLYLILFTVVAGVTGIPCPERTNFRNRTTSRSLRSLSLSKCRSDTRPKQLFLPPNFGEVSQLNIFVPKLLGGFPIKQILPQIKIFLPEFWG
jgi:hypothetical protein